MNKDDIPVVFDSIVEGAIEEYLLAKKEKSSLQDVVIQGDDEYDLLLAEKHEIIPGLWLGSQPERIDSSFKFVVSVNGTKHFSSPAVPIITTYYEDGPTIPPEELLSGLADLIIGMMKRGPVLVHCFAGMNRSALLVGLVLIKTGMTPADAIELMRTKRSKSVLHNTFFRNWLLAQ